jgi:hypothetical protein
MLGVRRVESDCLITLPAVVHIVPVCDDRIMTAALAE